MNQVIEFISEFTSKDTKRCVVQMFPVNKKYIYKGIPNDTLEFSTDFNKELVQNFKSGKLGKKLPVTDRGDHIHDLTKTPAWIVDLNLVNDGIDAVIELSNPEVAERIKNGEIQYISGEITFNYEDKETGEKLPAVVTGGAFTPRPYIKNMREAVVNFSEIETMEENMSTKNGVNAEVETTIATGIIDLSENKTVIELSEQNKSLEAKLSETNDRLKQIHEMNVKLSQQYSALNREKVLSEYSRSMAPAVYKAFEVCFKIADEVPVKLSEIKDGADATLDASLRDALVNLAENIKVVSKLSNVTPLEDRADTEEVTLGDDTIATMSQISKEADEAIQKGIDPLTAYKLAYDKHNLK